MAAFAADPVLQKNLDVAANKETLAQLVHPPIDEEEADGDNIPALLDSRRGRIWTVVGGCERGGIIPRRGPQLDSALLGTRGGPSRLGFDARVEELELVQDPILTSGCLRLHYKKVTG